MAAPESSKMAATHESLQWRGALVGALLASVIGLGFIWQNTTQERQATDVGNLPATNAMVAQNSSRILEIEQRISDMRDYLDGRITRLTQNLASDMRDQREQVMQTIEYVAEERARELDDQRNRINRLEELTMDLPRIDN